MKVKIGGWEIVRENKREKGKYGKIEVRGVKTGRTQEDHGNYDSVRLPNTGSIFLWLSRFV